jgi:nucleotide-binding universal stress UspA family protein
MGFKHILLDLESTPDPVPSREVALDVARIHDALVTALYVRTVRERSISAIRSSMIAGNEATTDFQRMAETQSEEDQHIERDAIERFMRAAGAATVTADHVSEIVTDNSGVVPYLVHHGRTADLIVTGRAGDNGQGADLGTIHDVLFGAGVPVVIVPSMPAGAIGRKVVIAWNGSRESARAVQDALPILERADAVHVVCVAQASPGSNLPPGAELARYLGCHGIEASLDNINDSTLSVGDTILGHIKDLGADLLVMGAYGHSRLREFVLGGVTKRILAHTPVPVLMSH